MPPIYILHENSEWIVPLHEAFKQRQESAKEMFLDQGMVDLAAIPPEGIFYNRMSASSHTRGHRYAPELTRSVLTWLESHGRRVINNSRALYFEVCKVSQYAALESCGINTPRTIVAVGKTQVIEAAECFAGEPFILKPNRGGKGLGVQLFRSINELKDYLVCEDYEAPLDGTWLVQAYVQAAENHITRCEFVGGKFVYSVNVNTEQGFELCPADSCQISEQVCPATAPSHKFNISHEFDRHEIITRYETFLQKNQIEIAGIELIKDIHGQLYTYDVNTNTNYNRRAELEAGVPLTGMDAIAEFLIQTRDAQYKT